MMLCTYPLLLKFGMYYFAPIKNKLLLYNDL